MSKNREGMALRPSIEPSFASRGFAVSRLAVSLAGAGLLLAVAGCSSDSPQTAELEQRQAAFEKQVATVETKLGQLEKQLAGLEAKPQSGPAVDAPPFDPSELMTRLAALETKLAALAARPVASATPSPSAEGSPAKATGTPALKVDSVIHDFGVTWAGPQLEHTFTITNIGNAPLKFMQVQPNCGCMTAGDYPKELAPGKSGRFPFTLDSTRVRGSYVKTIMVTTNDPEVPRLQLFMKGVSKRYIMVDPPTATFGLLREPDKSVSRVLTITNNAETPLELTLKPQSGLHRFDFELTEKEPGKVFELRVTTRPPYDPGFVSGFITLATNLESQKELRISAGGRVPKRLDVLPAKIYYYPPPRGTIGASQGVTRTVHLVNYGTTNVRVLEATIDDPSVTATVQEVTPGKRYTIQIKLPPDLVLPPGGRTLTLRTDDAEEPVIKVPIQGPPAGAKRTR